MSVRRRGTNSISDEDLLTRTSFVDARTAYKQVKKVREVKHLRDLISFIALCEFSFVTYLVYIKIGENNICIKMFLCIENTVVKRCVFLPSGHVHLSKHKNNDVHPSDLFDMLCYILN